MCEAEKDLGDLNNLNQVPRVERGELDEEKEGRHAAVGEIIEWRERDSLCLRRRCCPRFDVTTFP